MTQDASGAGVSDPALLDRARGGDVAAQVELAESLSAAGEAEAAATWLSQAASTQDAYATALLGAWQIYAHNVPADPEQGLARLHRAAESGESAACALLADLHAGGVAVAQDWSAALDWLLSAARMGNARALTQLAILQPGEDRDPLRTTLLWAAATRSYATAQALLGRLLARSTDAQQVQAGRAWLYLALRADSPLVTDSEGNASGPAPAIDLRGPSAIENLPWPAVRERIDISPWLRALGPEVVCSEEPSIKGFTGIASQAVCEYLIGLAGPLMRPAQVNDIRGGRRVHHMRTNSDAMIGPGNSDVLLRLVDHRVALASGLPVGNQESTAILRYRGGETYENHFDFIDPRVPDFHAEIETRGQRVATALVYLNEDYEGGATNFPKLGLALRGRTGDAIVWRNVAPDGSPEPRSLHAGMPPTQGEKWVLSKWIRSRAQSYAARA